jgi:ubiquinone/menaquinone biosynthesis C-methylase UbiE
MKDRDKITVAGGDTAKPYNLVKRLNLLDRYLSYGESVVLDGGCGRGDYVIAIRNKYDDIEAYGIEYMESKVAAFRRDQPGCSWVLRGDLQTIAFGKNTFDIVMLNEVLEHVPNDFIALQETNRVLKPGGIVIIFSPNRLFPFESHGVYIRASDQKLPPYVPFIPYIPLCIGKRVFRYWARNYWPFELRELIIETGFEVLETTYLWQTFENISGSQPIFIRKLRFLLRSVADFLEDVPILNAFGISQMIIAKKIENI